MIIWVWIFIVFGRGGNAAQGRLSWEYETSGCSEPRWAEAWLFMFFCIFFVAYILSWSYLLCTLFTLQGLVVSNMMEALVHSLFCFSQKQMRNIKQSPVQPSAAQRSPVQPSRAQYSPVRPSTAQYSPVRSKAQWGPVRPSKLRQTCQAAFAASSFSSWLYSVMVLTTLSQNRYGSVVTQT